jgi:ribosome biogenesis GTPase
VALEEIGWRGERAGDPDLDPMRVVLAERGAFRTSDGDEELVAVISGRLRHRAAQGGLPVVGDWVAVRRADPAIIEEVLPRRTALARRDPGMKFDQVLVANVDLALLVMGLDGDFNLRRLERYLALVGAAAVAPAIVLSKADLFPAADKLAEVRAAVPGVPVLAADLTGPLDPIASLLARGDTTVLLGSSGVGKSTLLNGLLGDDVQRTAPVRIHDSRGRHTTTRRQLFRLPGGAMVIDTPGLRELELSDSAGGTGDAFPDIAAIATGCRFRDCHHAGEPDCAVAAAVAAGSIGADRLAGYHKLVADPSRKRR